MWYHQAVATRFIKFYAASGFTDTTAWSPLPFYYTLIIHIIILPFHISPAQLNLINFPYLLVISPEEHTVPGATGPMLISPP